MTLDEAVVDALQEVLLDLRIGRLASRTVRVLTDGEEAYLPVGDLLAMGEVDFSIDETGTLNAVLHPGERRVVLSAEAPTALAAGTTIPVSPGSVVLHEGDLYVAIPLLEHLFGLVIRTDWVDLTAVVLDPAALPFGRRLAREARRQAGLGGSRTRGRSERFDLEQGAVGGAVLDWGFSSNVDDPTASTAYEVGLGVRVLGGGLQVSGRSLGAASTGKHRVDATYQSVFDEVGWLTQLRLGDGFMTGPRVRSARGFAVSNAPFLRPAAFATDEFAGRTGPGWEVELRQAGRTIDLTRADERGAFALDIPLSYGDNAVQVVSFGPHGEVVTSERLVLLGSDRLPGGTFEWGLSGGECRDTRCDLTGNLDLRYGASDRWTVRGGLEVFDRGGAPSLVQPYVSMSGAPLSSLELSGELVANGFVRVGATYGPSSRLRVRGAHTLFDREVEEPVLHDTRRLRTTEADVLLRPLSASSRWLLRSALLRQELETGTLSSVQTHTSFQTGGVGFELGLRHEINDPSFGSGTSRNIQSAAADGLISIPGRRKVWARGEIEWLDASRLRRVRGRLAYQVSPSARLEVTSGWQRGLGSSLSVSLSSDLASLRSTTLMTAQERAPARVTQISEGTVQWDGATRRLTTAPGPGLERGGISGYVFVDENGDGVRNVGERGLEGVRVVVGGRAVRTDAEGRHFIWDLVPYQSVDVWTDSTSIADPRLIPALGAVTVSIPPSSFGRLDIPVTPSHELWGRVVRVTRDGETPFARAELELREVNTGVSRVVRAFSDGEFYEVGITPGTYELTVPSDALHGLGLEPETPVHRFVVQAGGRARSPDPIVVRLLPAPEPIGEGGGW